jgi:sn-glycerol 3-phosphate transport system permease protein
MRGVEMIRPSPTLLSHLVLVLGVLIVAFPVYITFVASTQTAEQIVQNVPMSLLPGDNFLDSYRWRCSAGTEYGSRSPPPVAPMMGEPGSARWSSPSARSRSRCCRPSRSCTSASPAACLVFWMIFVTLMLPVEVRIGRPTRWCPTSACSTATPA